jgi:hypothetical protein
VHLYLDIETIPGLSEQIAAKTVPPGNISQSETIAAWEAKKFLTS